jgi:hypothetical protein
MYNMEISIGSYKCRMEICILAFVLFWIMFGHVLCSCCTMSMQEGFDMMKSIGMGKKEAYAPRARRAANVYDANNDTTTEGFVTAPRARRAANVYNDNNTEGFVTAPVAKKRIYDNNTTDSTETTDTTDTSTTTTEGFVSSNNKAYGPEFGASKAPGYIMRPDTWAQPTLAYSKGTTPSAGAQAILNRPKQPIPLPEGQLDMFATTKFDGDCCPNAFSNSMGCACMTTGQLNYLSARGGNNVPYSEY